MRSGKGGKTNHSAVHIHTHTTTNAKKKKTVNRFGSSSPTTVVVVVLLRRRRAASLGFISNSAAVSLLKAAWIHQSAAYLCLI
jgi:hypothetical protein